MAADLKALVRAWRNEAKGEHSSEWDVGYNVALSNCANQLESSIESAALRAEAGAVGWLPIESAPKDGTRVLAYAGSRPFIAHHGRTVGWWDDNDLMRDPTHWQPMPDHSVLANARPRPSQKD